MLQTTSKYNWPTNTDAISCWSNPTTSATPLTSQPDIQNRNYKSKAVHTLRHCNTGMTHYPLPQENKFPCLYTVFSKSRQSLTSLHSEQDRKNYTTNAATVHSVQFNECRYKTCIIHPTRLVSVYII